MKFMDFVALAGRRKSYAGDYGIEIETECERVYEPPVMNYWKADADGSLRNYGIEYSLRKPVNYNLVGDALEEFKTSLASRLFLSSAYTSVHIHMNISRMTLSETASLYTAYCLFEEVLNKYCGPTRDGNLFCLKNSIADRSVNTFKSIYKSLDKDPSEGVNSLFDLNESGLKYAACNVYTLAKFQSLEIRTHAGTTNIVEIQRWIDILEHMKIFALQFKPNEIIKYFHQEKNKTVIMNAVFGDLSDYLITDSLDRDLTVGLFYALQVAKSVTDWKTLDARCVKYSTKEPVEPTNRPEVVSRWHQVNTMSREDSSRAARQMYNTATGSRPIPTGTASPPAQPRDIFSSLEEEDF